MMKMKMTDDYKPNETELEFAKNLLSHMKSGVWGVPVTGANYWVDSDSRTLTLINPSILKREGMTRKWHEKTIVLFDAVGWKVETATEDWPHSDFLESVSAVMQGCVAMGGL